MDILKPFNSKKEVRELQTLVQEKLIGRIPIKNTKELVQLANKCHMVPGTHYTTFKDLYDIAESALNQYIPDLLKNDLMENIETLQEIQNLLPVETERSVDQSLFQQFSTPLVTAYIMSLLIDPKENDIIMEPSAGTGTLASFLTNSGAFIIVNEFHKKRFDLLKSSHLFQQCKNEDAIHIHNHPTFYQAQINKVIMNPPFSRHVNRSKVDILAGAKHLIAAYKTLQKKGTIVALMNSKFITGSKSFTYFKQQLPNATISFNCALDKQTFKRKGTKFETRVIVIHNHDPGYGIYTADKLDIPSVTEYLKLIS